MKLKQSRITPPEDGKCCCSSKPETDCCWQEPLSRIVWLSCGLYSISSCQSFLTTTNNFKSGLVKTLKHRVSTKVNSTKSSLNDCMQSWSLSCCEDWKRTLNKKLPLRLKLWFIVTWLIGKEYCTRESGPRFLTKIFILCLKTSQKWKT